MKVIIISAGSATRLGKHTKELPKGLLEVNGKSLLQWQIELFRKKGINEIIIIVGPHKEKYTFNTVKYLEDKKHDRHDVLQSLMVAEKIFKGQIITSYSDIIFEESILDDILSSKGDIQVFIDLDWEKKYKGRTEHPKEQADNVLIQNGRIIKIKKNIKEHRTDQIIGEFIGVLKFSSKGSQIFRDSYNRLRKSHVGKFQDADSFDKAYLTDMLQELIDKGIDVKPIIVKGKWFEIDTPQDLEIAKKEFKTSK